MMQNDHCIYFFQGGGAKPSYGGGGKGFDIPKLNIPNPIDFKAGVLR